MSVEDLYIHSVPCLPTEQRWQ